MSTPIVRAKFFVTDIQHPPTPGSDPYATKYTPSGQIVMSITNPDAIEAFEKGRAYFIDFTPAALRPDGPPVPSSPPTHNPVG